MTWQNCDHGTCSPEKEAISRTQVLTDREEGGGAVVNRVSHVCLDAFHPTVLPFMTSIWHCFSQVATIFLPPTKPSTNIPAHWKSDFPKIQNPGISWPLWGERGVRRGLVASALQPDSTGIAKDSPNNYFKKSSLSSSLCLCVPTSLSPPPRTTCVCSGLAYSKRSEDIFVA